METIMAPETTTSVLTPEALLTHWQGHRRVTRRLIEAFPEDKLFTYSIGGMRPFGDLVLEMLSMAVPGARGVATGEWTSLEDQPRPTTREELLQRWDADTEQLNLVVPTISSERYQADDTAFEAYAGKGWYFIFYFIDNEIHHRGQGYVYLRSLGIEPPAFWNRE
jgi:uncharacterized damage-inducible protein DinB